MITEEKYAHRRFFFRDHGRRGAGGPFCVRDGSRRVGGVPPRDGCDCGEAGRRWCDPVNTTKPQRPSGLGARGYGRVYLFLARGEFGGVLLLHALSDLLVVPH